MPQNSFVFKHFVLNQDRSPMKAGTDAMILGAYIPDTGAKQILDIGTGTGILSLMLVQRFQAQIVAVDPDQNACEEAGENFRSSSWTNRLEVFQSAIQDYNHGPHLFFDLIVSNPPYFETNHTAKIQSEKYQGRIGARSFDSLSYDDLIKHAAKLLAIDGVFYVIIPALSAAGFINIAINHNLNLIDQLHIYSKPNQKPIRNVLGFSYLKKDLVTNEMVIYESDGNYTNGYIALTRDFYAIDQEKRKVKNQIMHKQTPVYKKKK